MKMEDIEKFVSLYFNIEKSVKHVSEVLGLWSVMYDLDHVEPSKYDPENLIAICGDYESDSISIRKAWLTMTDEQLKEVRKSHEAKTAALKESNEREMYERLKKKFETQ